ncbi:hypothetical protein ACNKHT_09600 [Shigella flexneri]
MTLQQNGYHADTCPPTTATKYSLVIMPVSFDAAGASLSLCAGEQWIRQVTGFSRGELFVGRFACHVRWLYCWLVRRWLYPRSNAGVV